MPFPHPEWANCSAEGFPASLLELLCLDGLCQLLEDAPACSWLSWWYALAELPAGAAQAVVKCLLWLAGLGGQARVQAARTGLMHPRKERGSQHCWFVKMSTHLIVLHCTSRDHATVCGVRWRLICLLARLPLGRSGLSSLMRRVTAPIPLARQYLRPATAAAVAAEQRRSQHVP